MGRRQPNFDSLSQAIISGQHESDIATGGVMQSSVSHRKATSSIGVVC